MKPVFTYFAVDKGNMTLVQFSNGINMLVDCRVSAVRPSPLQYLKGKITDLHFVVITHPHQDHLTGLKEVCEHFRPKYLWHNGRYFKPDPIYDDWSYYEALRGGKYNWCQPTAVRSGHTASIGAAKLKVIGPTLPYLEGTPDDENNNSIILKISAGSSSFILTGDSQEEQWNAVDLDAMRGVTTFLASHHGRETGFPAGVIRSIKPQLVIISDGEPADGDATHKYERIATVKTTRERSLVVRPQGMPAAIPT